MSNKNEVAQGFIALLGRICFSAVFIIAGIHMIVDFNNYTALLNNHWFINMPVLAVVLAIVFELLGGVLVFLGLFTRFGAFLLFLILVPMTLFLHSFWLIDTAAQKMGQLQHFLKNAAMIGASLYIMAYGAGRFSFDRWFRCKN